MTLIWPSQSGERRWRHKHNLLYETLLLCHRFVTLTAITGTNLVCVFEFEAGDDLSLQLVVVSGFVQNVLAKLGDVSFASLSQHRVQAII